MTYANFASQDVMPLVISVNEGAALDSAIMPYSETEVTYTPHWTRYTSLDDLFR